MYTEFRCSAQLVQCSVLVMTGCCDFDKKIEVSTDNLVLIGYRVNSLLSCISDSFRQWDITMNYFFVLHGLVFFLSYLDRISDFRKYNGGNCLIRAID